MKSLLAGLCISLGGVAYLAVGGLPGAVLFGIGLLLIIEMNFDLFTGRVCFATWRDVPKVTGILIRNFLACASMGILVRAMRPDLAEKAVEICIRKFAEGWNVIPLGMFCNVLIYFAVVSRKPLTVIFCVTAFIMSGFEHSIANTFYMAVAGLITSQNGVLYIILNVIGNALGGVLIHRLVNVERWKHET